MAAAKIGEVPILFWGPRDFWKTEECMELQSADCGFCLYWRRRKTRLKNPEEDFSWK
jgi:hypothetical protein